MKEIPTLWYENENGERWLLPDTRWCGDPPPPEGFCYQHSRFPNSVRHLVLGVENDKSHMIAAMESTWSAKLVMAMARPSLKERAMQFLRYGRFAPKIGLHQAILHASVSCEACGNVLRHRYGIDDGYRKYSEEWVKSNTSCELCRCASKACGVCDESRESESV